jgi:mono/diheme cytochrome c family protein
LVSGLLTFLENPMTESRFRKPCRTGAARAAFAAAALGAVLIGLAAPVEAAGQQASPAGEGRTLFNTYCASCHGTSGVGNGPVASSMRRTPPDITGLSLANGGIFPAERMRRIVDGREVGAHGNREMPVWGDAFKSIPGGRSEDAVRARIAAVVAYLESIQRQRAQ